MTLINLVYNFYNKIFLNVTLIIKIKLQVGRYPPDFLLIPNPLTTRNGFKFVIWNPLATRKITRSSGFLMGEFWRIY